jgi:hypothetical protein
MEGMKSNQKCVRLSDRVLKYIDGYRGENFSQKLENYVLDVEERREQLTLDWERLMHFQITECPDSRPAAGAGKAPQQDPADG